LVAVTFFSFILISNSISSGVVTIFTQSYPYVISPALELSKLKSTPVVSVWAQDDGGGDSGEGDEGGDSGDEGGDSGER
jgi:hypothetical protein